MLAILVAISALLCRAEVSCEVYESSILNRETILLGGVFPIHDSSEKQVCTDLQDFAVEQVEAMVFAIDCINNNSTLLPNVTLAFTIRDTCSNPSHALDQTFKFVQNENETCSNATDKLAISGVVGEHYSSVSMDVANLLRLYSIPQISYTSTADILSDKSRFDYFFRTVPPDSLQARAIADIIVEFGWTYIFALYSDDTYGNGGIDALLKKLGNEKIKVCIAARIPLSIKAVQSDYEQAVREMSADWVANASIAVLFGHLEAAEGIMDALAAFRNSTNGSRLEDLTWIGTDSWGDAIPERHHEAAHGMLTVLPFARASEGLEKYFTSLHPSNYTDNIWFREFWESRFDCSFSDMTCDVRNESLLNHTQYSLATLIMDAVMAFAHATHNLIENRCPDGNLCDAILVDRLTGQAVNGELIREHLYNISFRGASSNLVTFDAQGNEPGAYYVKNLQRVSDGQYSFENIGTWDHQNSLNISTDKIQWVSNGTIPQSYCSNRCEAGHQQLPVTEQECCWTCSPCQSEKGFSDGLSQCTDCNRSHMPNPTRSECVPIPVTFLRWKDGWAIGLIAVTICGLLITTCVTVVLVYFHDHKVVKASSREVSAILLLGLALCYIMPFFFMATPSEAICAIRRFGVGFSFSVCYSALLVKTNRIHRIFNQDPHNGAKPPRFIGPLSQVLLTVILISIQVLIAVVWLSIERPSIDIIYASRSAELRCGESPVIGLSVSLGYNLLLLALSTYFAFRARKVPENFNEARYINVTLYTLCIVWLAFIPTYFGTAQLGAVFQTSSLTIAIIMSATTTLACLFVPRIILLATQLKKASTKALSESNFTNSTSVARKV